MSASDPFGIDGIKCHSERSQAACMQSGIPRRLFLFIPYTFEAV
jgi:hypothetical protein